jgi:hypothetical protein
MVQPDKKHLETQVELSKRLSLGFVLTVIPAFGVISFCIGVRSYRQIVCSEFPLAGHKMALWCMIVGFCEAAICAYAVIALILLNRYGS